MYNSPFTIDLPKNVALWNWIFSHLTKPPSETRSYVDAATGFSINFHSVRSLSTYISTALVQHHGLEIGDCVSIFAGNTVWWPVGMFAVIRVGGIVSGSSPAYSVDEMVYALKTTKSKFLFTLPESLEVAVTAAEKCGLPKKRIFLLDGEAEGHLTLHNLVEQGIKIGDSSQTPEFVIPYRKTNHDVTAFLSFSSGTTGLPKAVKLSHQNLIAQCLQCTQMMDPSYDKCLAALPFFHICVNADVFMIRRFSMAALLEAVVKYKITELLVVPPILIRLVRDSMVDQYDLSHVRYFATGAAPLSKEIIHQMSLKFPNATIRQGYGMTESCACITATRSQDANLKNAHSVGVLVPSTSIKIVDPENCDKELPTGVPGELLAKGPQIVQGYLNNDAANKSLFTADGWLRTGDQAMVDENGTVFITDRIKDLIKVKGVPVAPAELEDLLLQHPEVEDCGVTGIPDDYSGEVPRAYVVTKQGKNTENLRAELVQFVADRKIREKWLAGGVIFVKAVPKSPAGKILRRHLRSMVEEVKAKL